MQIDEEFNDTRGTRLSRIKPGAVVYYNLEYWLVGTTDSPRSIPLVNLKSGQISTFMNHAIVNQVEARLVVEA